MVHPLAPICTLLLSAQAPVTATSLEGQLALHAPAGWSFDDRRAFACDLRAGVAVRDHLAGPREELAAVPPFEPVPLSLSLGTGDTRASADAAYLGSAGNSRGLRFRVASQASADSCGHELAAAWARGRMELRLVPGRSSELPGPQWMLRQLRLGSGSAAPLAGALSMQLYVDGRLHWQAQLALHAGGSLAGGGSLPGFVRQEDGSMLLPALVVPLPARSRAMDIVLEFAATTDRAQLFAGGRSEARRPMPPCERAPAATLLASPNPTRRGLRIYLDPVPATGQELWVFDVAGRRRARLYAPAHGVAGIPWDGRGEDGERLPAGRYFVVGRAGVLPASVLLLR